VVAVIGHHLPFPVVSPDPNSTMSSSDTLDELPSAANDSDTPSPHITNRIYDSAVSVQLLVDAAPGCGGVAWPAGDVRPLLRTQSIQFNSVYLPSESCYAFLGSRAVPCSTLLPHSQWKGSPRTRKRHGSCWASRRQTRCQRPHY
jgi:hypothetical protein